MEGYNTIENEDDLILWIHNNPNAIEFASPTEAINQYNIVKDKMTHFYTINSSFFVKLKDLELSDVKKIVKVETDLFIGTIENPIQTTGCWGDCIDAANQCSKEAQQVYEEKLAYAILVGSTSMFAPAAVGMAANAYFERVLADKVCAQGLKDCVDACD
ncbi:hypothetical protein MG290_12685 [Flavobacterium sp. CBA20B-1]|uniref:hypothetical protein n=1 Tax=unclassified Flavobacterium TaxID=196869 RepID=UPI002224D77A|nr:MULTISPECIES: hypothetical protein [unclassified Flavobacterium]WCM41786.1 hypothetical protein MG290_12685 [Flavobacterium sp. CBA20B-1]